MGLQHQLEQSQNNFRRVDKELVNTESTIKQVGIIALVFYGFLNYSYFNGHLFDLFMLLRNCLFAYMSAFCTESTSFI